MIPTITFRAALLIFLVLPLAVSADNLIPDTLRERAIALRRDLVVAMTALLEPLGVTLGNNQAGGGADIGPLRKRGVPVLAPQQDGSTYFDVHHTKADTLGKIDPDSLNQNVAVYATLAFIASNLKTDFGRLDNKVE